MRRVGLAPFGPALVGLTSAFVACASAPVADELPPALRGVAVGAEHGSPHPGERAPDFTLPRIGARGADRGDDRIDQGAPFSLSSARGSVVLLHFTATWCPFCREEIAALNDIAQDLGPRGVKVVLVDVMEPAEHFAAFSDVSPEVVALVDADGAVATRYAPQHAQPFLERPEVVLAGSLIIDRDGVIRTFVLADSRNYDPTLADLRTLLERHADRAPATGTPAPAKKDAPPTEARVTDVRAPVVTVSAPPSARVAPGGRVTIDVVAHIPDGFHVMSDAPPDGFIATTLSLTGDDVTVEALQWPAAQPFSFSSPSDDSGVVTLPTFAGAVSARATLAVDADAALGPRVVRGSVRAQACTKGRCFMPRQAPFELTLLVER